MTQINDRTLSKKLSYVLRHRPDSIGLSLNAEGWAGVQTLLTQLGVHGFAVDLDRLRHVVETSDKKRFTLSADAQRIRAAQGHSIDVSLGFTPLVPPQVLYHGTAKRNLTAIRAEGLRPGARQHVHLSAQVDTARTVGARHGAPHVLTVSAAAMHAAGHAFYQADNGVWLTNGVPPRFIDFEQNE